jgi:hypothetical protein
MASSADVVVDKPATRPASASAATGEIVLPAMRSRRRSRRTIHRRPRRGQCGSTATLERIPGTGNDLVKALGGDARRRAVPATARQLMS